MINLGFIIDQQMTFDAYTLRLRMLEFVSIIFVAFGRSDGSLMTGHCDCSPRICHVTPGLL